MESIIDRMALLQKVYNTTMAKIQNIIEKEKEYYTPNIEDIRVGYELEYHNFSMDETGEKESNFDRWEKCILAKGNVATFMEYGIGKGVRVMYLTKDQIEAEGFKILKKSDNNYIYATKDKYIEMRYDMGHVTLAIYNTIDAGSQLINLPAFYGECKSINEFRYIIKLLGI